MATGVELKPMNRKNMIRRLRQGAVRRIYKTLDARTERNDWPQWFLLAGRCALESATSPDPSRLVPIVPPPDRFWADPFAWSWGGREFVFFEEYLRSTRRGRISVMSLDAGLRPQGEAQPVIDEAWHLSYPFLLEHEGTLYMVPESARTKRIDLYRCDEFPHRWSHVHTLIEGIEAADATLLEHDGRWWLFCAARLGKAKINASLLAFHADSPLSRRWIPHAGNPLILDFGSARPGGRIIRAPGDRMVRPGQDSVPRYGAGLGLYAIDTLTPEHYAEHRIWHSTGAKAGGWHAMHHMDWHDGVLVMDAQRLLPRDGEPRSPNARS